MIIFFYGTDGYRLKQATGQLVREYQKKNPSGMSLARFDLAEAGQIQKLDDNISSASFFEAKKLLVAKNAFNEAEKFAELVKNRKVSDDKETVLIIVENNTEAVLVKRSKKLWNLAVAKPNIVKNIEPLSGGKLEKWADEKIKDLGLKIQPTALKKLLLFVGPNQERLNNELEKLSAYSVGSGKAINENEMEDLVYQEVNPNNFALTDSLANKNRSQAIVLLDQYLSRGEDPFALLGLLVYQFRNLLKIKSLVKEATPYGQLAKLTGLHPFVAKKTYEQAKKFEMNELKATYGRLSALDINSKSGLTDLPVSLFAFFAEI